MSFVPDTPRCRAELPPSDCGARLGKSASELAQDVSGRSSARLDECEEVLAGDREAPDRSDARTRATRVPLSTRSASSRRSHRDRARGGRSGARRVSRRRARTCPSLGRPGGRSPGPRQRGARPRGRRDALEPGVAQSRERRQRPEVFDVHARPISAGSIRTGRLWSTLPSCARSTSGSPSTARTSNAATSATDGPYAVAPSSSRRSR